MKNFFVSLSVLFLITLTAGCENKHAAAANIEATAPVEAEKPVPKLSVVTPASVFVGPLDGSEWGGNSEIGKYKEEVINFPLVIEISGKKYPLIVSTSDEWFPEGEVGTETKDPGRTEALKALWDELKKKKAEDFSVTKTDDEKILKVVLNPVYKEGKDGQVGEIVSPERLIWGQ
ncbi:MAG TPA: hypothetical protein VLB02_03025 [Candidatus Paceibacterota bacterium]|nr:hypothetical protein [Candidatus Paceibacterota bacterium]